MSLFQCVQPCVVQVYRVGGNVAKIREAIEPLDLREEKEEEKVYLRGRRDSRDVENECRMRKAVYGMQTENDAD